MTDGTSGRPTRSGSGDHLAEDGAVPGVPGGWPTPDEPATRPTSPATSTAAAAAGRAAYADAPKGTDPKARTNTGAGTPASADPGVEASSPESDRSDGPEPTGTAPAAETPSRPETAEPAGGGYDLAAERLADLQRLQAEYVNYKRRVDRDREVEKERAVARVVESLLPVLDEIQLARQHGELEGPFAKIAEKLEATLGRHGVARYGEPGDVFDPVVHEAVMHMEAELAPGTTATTVIQVMQPGYRLGDKVVRAALVAVADPA